MKGLHLFLQAQCTRDIEAGEQLFTSYGDLFWSEQAPINRAAIDENKLLDIGDEPAVEEEVDDEVMGMPLPIQTPRSVAKEKTSSISKRHKNASSLTQPDDSFLSPLSSLDTFDDDPSDWCSTPLPVPELKRSYGSRSSSTTSSTSKGKRTLSSRKGKDVALDKLPQATTDSPLSDSASIKKNSRKRIKKISYDSDEDLPLIVDKEARKELLAAEALMYTHNTLIPSLFTYHVFIGRQRTSPNSGPRLRFVCVIFSLLCFDVFHFLLSLIDVYCCRHASIADRDAAIAQQKNTADLEAALRLEKLTSAQKVPNKFSQQDPVSVSENEEDDEDDEYTDSS